MNKKLLHTLIGFSVLLAIVFFALCFFKQHHYSVYPTLPTPPLSIIRSDPDIKILSNAECDFGLTFFKTISLQNPKGNTFCSPFSLFTNLAIIMNGAKGNTQKEIYNTLGYKTISIDKFNNANCMLIGSLQNPDSVVTSNIADSIWTDTGFTLSNKYQFLVSRYYNAEIQSLPFTKPGASDIVNHWVDNATSGKIDQIVDDSEMSESRMLAINAMYFHGQWTNKFDKNNTSNSTFTLENGDKKTFPFMEQNGTYLFACNDKFTLIRIPYGRDRIAMYIILPLDRVKLDTIINSINSRNWNSLMTGLTSDSTDLYLPRFSIKDEIRLKPVLIQLGIKQAFTQSADFSLIGSLKNLSISKVKQKTLLEVNEEGTTASAVTATEVASSDHIPVPHVLRVDHPFLCTIRDDITGAILFIGAIRDPQS